MSMEYIRSAYSVPAKRGMRIEYFGGEVVLRGTITGAHNGHIKVRLDGDKNSRTFHPAWKIRYITKATS